MFEDIFIILSAHLMAQRNLATADLNYGQYG